jgi:flagellar L-ring protein precursor FlgH
MMRLLIWALAVACAGTVNAKKKPETAPPLDLYVEEMNARTAAAPAPSPGAIWTPGARLSDAARDLRASQVDDTVTILVVENASAVAKGSTKTQRASSTSASVNALGGLTRAVGPLANLAGASGDTQLSGEGATSRDVIISTTLTARVAAVFPNGAMLLEASKDVSINSERQIIAVRGVVRPADIASGNTVRSDRLAQLEVRVNGKGVVGDAIRRPFVLYRILLGLLPF